MIRGGHRAACRSASPDAIGRPLSADCLRPSGTGVRALLERSRAVKSSDDQKYLQYRAMLAARDAESSRQLEEEDGWNPREARRRQSSAVSAATASLLEVVRRLPEAHPSCPDTDSARTLCDSLALQLEQMLPPKCWDGDRRPTPRTHPLAPEVVRVQQEIAEHIRVIETCRKRYPKKDGSVQLPQLQALRWEENPTGGVLYADDAEMLTVRRYKSGSAVYFSRAEPADVDSVGEWHECVARSHGRGPLAGVSPAAAQAWARKVMGASGLGLPEPWHGGEVERHSWHDAASSWHDLMVWTGAPPEIVDLFRYSCVTHSGAPGAVKLD